MKVLILSCNTGGGHNSAAKAIAAELTKQNIPWEIRNSLDFVPKIKRDFLERGHSLMYRFAPKLYGTAYALEERQKTHLSLYLDYAKYAWVVKNYIRRNKFDAIICVHIFPALMMTSARRHLRLNVLQYFVATDYSVAPGLEETEMDAYFIPRGFSDMFSKKLHGRKLIESGIPVAEDLYHPISKAEARRILGVRDDVLVVLISAGSIGCGPIRELAENIRKIGGQDVSVVTLCGHNRRLLKKLSNENCDGLFLPIGFTNKVRYWLTAADMMFTKAGGLSTTEAATVGLPLVLMNAVPGLEQENLEYFVKNGCAVTANSVEELCKAAVELNSSPEAKEKMLEFQRTLFSQNAVEEISRVLQKSQP